MTSEHRWVTDARSDAPRGSCSAVTLKVMISQAYELESATLSARHAEHASDTSLSQWRTAGRAGTWRPPELRSLSRPLTRSLPEDEVRRLRFVAQTDSEAGQAESLEIFQGATPGFGSHVRRPPDVLSQWRGLVSINGTWLNYDAVLTSCRIGMPRRRRRPSGHTDWLASLRRPTTVASGMAAWLIVQRGGRQQATDRNLAVGHVDVQLVADPGGLVATCCPCFMPTSQAVGRSSMRYRRQAHGSPERSRRLEATFGRSSPLLSAPSPFALGRRRRLADFDGRLLAMASIGASVGRVERGGPTRRGTRWVFQIQRFVHSAGRRSARRRPRTRRRRVEKTDSSRHLDSASLPATPDPCSQHHVGVQSVQRARASRSACRRPPAPGRHQGPSPSSSHEVPYSGGRPGTREAPVWNASRLDSGDDGAHPSRTSTAVEVSRRGQ